MIKRCNNSDYLGTGITKEWQDHSNRALPAKNFWQPIFWTPTRRVND